VPSSSTLPTLSDRSLRYLDLLLDARRTEATEELLGEIDAGRLTVHQLYLDVFAPVLHEVGRRAEARELSIAHEHYISAVTQSLMSRLYPQILATPRRDRVVVAACAGDELHEIGLRMVVDLLEMDGWISYYLGANVPVQVAVEAARERRADLLALSATMTEHRHDARAIIRGLRKTPGLEHTLVLVGGAAFNDSESWREVGADGHASDALAAMHLANELVDRREATPAAAERTA